MRELGSGDTVLCTATMGFRPLREFIEAAAGAGFTAVSLSGADYKGARASGLSDADLRGLLADNDLRVAELDGIVDWLRPLPAAQGVGYGLDNPFFGHTIEEFFAIGETIGARSVTAVDPFMGTAALDEMSEAFARLCDRAIQHQLLVHLEFLSWGPVADLATAWEIVRRADRPNGGLMLDTLHLVRSDSEDVLAEIPGERIFATQFCDGTVERRLDPFSDAANRLWPGQGEFDLAQILRELRAKGCTAPLGIEVMNDQVGGWTSPEVAEKAFTSLSQIKTQAQKQTKPPRR